MTKFGWLLHEVLELQKEAIEMAAPLACCEERIKEIPPKSIMATAKMLLAAVKRVQIAGGLISDNYESFSMFYRIKNYNPKTDSWELFTKHCTKTEAAHYLKVARRLNPHMKFKLYAVVSYKKRHKKDARSD